MGVRNNYITTEIAIAELLVIYSIWYLLSMLITIISGLLLFCSKVLDYTTGWSVKNIPVNF